MDGADDVGRDGGGAGAADQIAGSAVGLALDGVSVRFGDVVALDDVSVVFASGKTTALIGPSGCGKSTILRVLIGLQVPTDGRATVGDLVLDAGVGGAALRELRRGCGYMLQDGGLFPHLTTGANATMMGRELGWARERVASRLEELAGLVRLDVGVLDRYPGELSGGQRQRVALMRALFLDPPVLLLDEPLGALDPIVRFDLQAELREIIRRLGKTVVLVTHDLAEAAYLGDRIVLLHEGRVAQEGEPERIVASPANEFVERFVRAQRSHMSELAGGERGGR